MASRNPGPSLTSRFSGLVDVVPKNWLAKLGLTKIEQKEPNEIDVDAISPTLVESDVESTYTGERKKTNKSIGDPTGVTLQGQEYDPRYNYVRRYAQTMPLTGAVLGNAGTEVTPLGIEYDLATTIDLTAIQAALAGVFRSFPGRSSIEVPPILLGITPTPALGQGAGIGIGAGSGSGSGSGWMWSIHQNNSSEANASAIYEFVPLFKYPWAKNIRVQDYFLFIVGPNTTDAAVIAALLLHFSITVNLWPLWDPEPVQFLAKGQNIRIRASAEGTADASAFANDSGAGSSSSSSNTSEESFSVENILRVYEYQPSIHAHITSLIGLASTIGANATAAVGVGGGSSVSLSQTATAQVSIDIPATNVTTWPTSGLYLYDVQSESSDYGMIMIRARVLDFANFR